MGGSASGSQRQQAGQRGSGHVPFVPIHSWSCSSLKVSLTFPPDLLYIPDKGTVGRRSCGEREGPPSKEDKYRRTDGTRRQPRQPTGPGFESAHDGAWLTWAPFTDGITSSGFPLSNTFLCCCNASQKSSLNESFKTAFVIFPPLKSRTKKA